MATRTIGSLSAVPLPLEFSQDEAGANRHQGVWMAASGRYWKRVCQISPSGPFPVRRGTTRLIAAMHRQPFAWAGLVPLEAQALLGY